jgi:hypothetical protein
MSTAGSQAATNEAGNKVVTVEEKTHVTWQDVTSEGYFNRIRTLNRLNGEWSPIETLGSARDDHARAVLVADSAGFHHVILSGHNTACTYRRSKNANDSSDWTAPVEVADGTYPYLVCGPDETLFLTLRNANRWNGVELYAKPKDAPWGHVGKIIERLSDYQGYAAFSSGHCFNSQGVLHLVTDFYEGFGIWDQRGIHQAIGYLQSPDGGKSWWTYRGKRALLPARPCTMDVICESTGLRHEPMPPPVLSAHGNIAVDPDGIPHVMYLYHLNRAGEIILASPNAAGVWQQRSIDVLTRHYPEYSAAMCRGTFTIDTNGVFRALITLVHHDHPLWNHHLPTREGLKGTNDGSLNQGIGHPIVWLISHDGGTTFSVEEALAEKVNARSPKYELAVSGITSPTMSGILYFDNTSLHLQGFPEDGGYQNRVYYCQDTEWS